MLADGERPVSSVLPPTASTTPLTNVSVNGIALMREVAACAGDLSARRMAERDLNRWWDRIGHWLA